MMSSSEMKEASCGVPSPLVMVTNSNLFRKDLGDGTSQSLDAVADEGNGHCGQAETTILPIKKMSLCRWIQQVHTSNTPSIHIIKQKAIKSQAT